MAFFKKQIKFISAICPECKGHLELDPRLERAFCQYCGAQCLIENAPKHNERVGKFDKILDFIERQQSLRRQDKQEERRREEEEKRARKLHWKTYWWIYALLFLSFIALGILLSALEKAGII